MTSATCDASQLSTPMIARWLDLIRAEYREMPCLSLTKPQMQRLWGLDGYVCDALIDALIAAGVLRLRGSMYVAATSSR